MSEAKLVLVTGGTGYIATTLTPYLLRCGYRVRCLARDPGRTRTDYDSYRVEVVKGDVTDFPSLVRAMEGVSTAYYLVHNMISGKDYHERDMLGARNFAEAAGMQGVEHIIYLGGLADPSSRIGRHMRSRIQTGDVLRQGKVPVTEFRASLVIGSGSTSFEMIRYLVEQFPILFGPRWMHYYTQPIAIQNVIDYLIAALEHPHCRGKIYEIGGADVLTYRETLLLYARLRGLKRRIIMVPLIPVRLMAFMVDRLTPIRFQVAYPLIDGMRSDSVVLNNQAKSDFTDIRILNYNASVTGALERLSPAHLNRTWEDGHSLSHRLKQQGFFIDYLQVEIEACPDAVYRAFHCLGGKFGWLYLDSLWRLRGAVDRLAGGPGMRGRTNDEWLNQGDRVDFYLVELNIPDQLLRLKAELKAPGDGWMEWQVRPQMDGKVSLMQAAFFAPKGLAGFLYWYLLLPFHRFIFKGLFRALLRNAKKNQQEGN